MDEVSIDQIKPSPYQLRLSFKVEDLKEEIQRDGLLSPLIVRRKDGYYELIDGQRRLEVLKELGWKKVPVEIQEVDDKKARLMVYKLNAIRESYSVEERAKYFKKLADDGMLPYQIGKELNVDDNWVRAHLNIFKFPEDIQNAVWEGEFSVSQIRELEPLIGANIEEATKVASELILRRVKKLDETRELLKPRMEEIEKARIKAAKEALGAAAPISIRLETPEEFEKAAKTLWIEAKKKREETLTPEERAELEADRRRKEEERKKRAEKAQQILEEKVRTKVEQEVRVKATEELLKQPEFVRQLVKRPEVRQVLEETRKVEAPSQKQGYLTLEEPLPVQYQHQREWNLKQLVGRELNGKEFKFDFVTIGYSQKTLQDLTSLLKLAKVTLLIDVRRNPQSMYRPEFNKDKLEKELTGIGVEYIHMPQLGIPRDARDEVYEGAITPKELLEQYETEALTNQAVDKLLETVKGKGTFALLCTEIDPIMCHRHKIAEALIERGMVGYDL
jgi:ParB family chromosome partitioning protein